MNKTYKYIHLIVMTLFILASAILLYRLGADGIIEVIGEKNAYVFIALFAFFGGISSITSVSYNAAIIALAVGGLDPWLIALVSGPGMLVGDCVFYLFGNAVEGILSKKITQKIDRFAQFLFRPKVCKRSPLFIFLYTSVSWLPVDLLILPLSVAKYPLKKMIVPLLLGEMLFLFLVTSIAKYGFPLFLL